MPFIHVNSTGIVTERRERTSPSDPQHEFLTDANPLITTVQSGGQLSIFRSDLFDIAIEQKEFDPSDIDLPDLSVDRSFSCLNMDDYLHTIGAGRGFDRQPLILNEWVDFPLPTGFIDLL